MKVDIQSCFNSIPQNQMLRQLENLLKSRKYLTGKYAKFGPPESYHGLDGKRINGRPSSKWITTATAIDAATSLQDLNRERLDGKSNTVLLPQQKANRYRGADVLKLINEHVEKNIVKIGKTYHRQRNGIPQGSVLSTLLCNYFYSHFENDRLGFLSQDDSLLFRFIDDFLLITVNLDEAHQFLNVMLTGDTDYGVSVKRDKTMVNFHVEMHGSPVTSTECTKFPYCGISIDTVNLNIAKDSKAYGNESEYSIS